jgi:hypothetical protein
VTNDGSEARVVDLRLESGGAARRESRRLGAGESWSVALAP